MNYDNKLVFFPSVNQIKKDQEINYKNLIIFLK